MNSYRTCICFCLMQFAIPLSCISYAKEMRDIPHGQRIAYQLLNLKADASDEEIVEKLNDVNKILAMNLIQRKHIESAIPNLLAIVKDDNEHVLPRSKAAEVLYFFGNKEWVPIMKELAQSQKPQSALEIYDSISLAGVLALAGDYSYFPLSLESLKHKKAFVRSKAARTMSKYVHETNPVSDIASDALLECAVNDPNEIVKTECIYSLERMCAKRPDYRGKLITALEANIAKLKNKELVNMFEEKLKVYKNEE